MTKTVVQDLGNEALIAPVDPEVAAATELDWKCLMHNCRMPATHMVSLLDDDDRIVNHFLVCPIHADEFVDDDRAGE